jgi:NTE family protein
MYDWYSHMKAKTALVLSAGGMFGAYQAGAWRELSGSFRPDIVIGTSVGALNAWAIVGGCPPDELIRQWTSPAAAAFLQLRMPPLPWRGLFDYDRFSHNIQELYSAFQPRIPCGIVVTDLLRRRPRLVQSADIRWEHLAAACAIPAGVRPVRVDGRLCVDGGLLNAVPLWAAKEMGAGRAVVVNALPRLQSRVVRTVVGAVRSISPRLPEQGDLEVVTIAPSSPLGSLMESVRWDRDAVLRSIARGADDSRRALVELQSGRDPARPVLQ